MGLGKIGLETDGLAKRRGRFLVCALRLQSDAEIGVGGREIGFGGDGLAIAGLGLREAAGLVMMDGRNEQRSRVFGRTWNQSPHWRPAVRGS